MKRPRPVSNLRQVHLLPKGKCCRQCLRFDECREEIVDLAGDEEICDFDPPRFDFTGASRRELPPMTHS
ncbi:MAG TPA: hypothetical protein VNJ47_12135 [Nevskiales bacterium]|nr:hypothetical protein [Nevskiales bacterium]